MLFAKSAYFLNCCKIMIQRHELKIGDCTFNNVRILGVILLKFYEEESLLEMPDQLELIGVRFLKRIHILSQYKNSPLSERFFVIGAINGEFLGVYNSQKHLRNLVQKWIWVEVRVLEKAIKNQKNQLAFKDSINNRFSDK